MSIKELYELAVAHGVEDKPIRLEYFADDGWYSWSGDLAPHDAKSSSEDDIEITPEKDGIVITIYPGRNIYPVA